MKIKDIEVGKIFTIDETLTYPKLRIENGYVDMRDEIIKTGSHILEMENVREISLKEVCDAWGLSNIYENIRNWYKEIKDKYIGRIK